VQQQNDLPEKPIGVIASVAAGMDAVIQAWWIPLFPVLIDLFLWFGPRLSVLPVIERSISTLTSVVGQNAAADFILEAARELNYFALMTIAPLGVPSLMAFKVPQATPWITPQVFSIHSVLAWIALFAALFLAGLLVGGVYLALMAQQVRDGRLQLGRLLRLLPRYWLSIVGLILALFLVVVMIGTPFLIVVSVISSFSSWIAMLVMWVALMLFLWLVFHLFFAIHGMLLSEEPLRQAVWNSIRLTAFNSFPTMGLLLVTFGVSAGLDYLWSLPAEDSWMLLIGVAGHAIISSGLLASTFVYYQDRYRYWRELRAYLTRVATGTLEKTQ
jgi:hypothetical protein